MCHTSYWVPSPYPSVLDPTVSTGGPSHKSTTETIRSHSTGVRWPFYESTPVTTDTTSGRWYILLRWKSPKLHPSIDTLHVKRVWSKGIIGRRRDPKQEFHVILRTRGEREEPLRRRRRRRRQSWDWGTVVSLETSNPRFLDVFIKTQTEKKKKIDS